MNKQITKEKVESLPEFMERFNAVFSLNTDSGWVNVVFEKDYNKKLEMKVRFFDEDDQPLQDEFGDGGVPVEEVTKVAEFIKGMKDMRLSDYELK